MLMLMTVLFVGVAAMAVTFLMVSGIAPKDQPTDTPRPVEKLAASSKFFADEAQGPATRPEIPVEVLLSQIQRHVRLEQAAAETYVSLPTEDSLHSRTASPLVN